MPLVNNYQTAFYVYDIKPTRKLFYFRVLYTTYEIEP